MVGRSYRVSDAVLEELKEAGLGDVAIASLRSCRNVTFNRKDFTARLEQLGPRTLDEAERKLILKYTRLSLLRLERLIPNRGLREWVDALVFAVIIASIVRTFIIAPFKIPSGSMYPTIKVGDHIFATMFSYGIPIPFTDIKIDRHPVKRGDIVIFPYPENPSVDYIKRVIGVGGDTVEMIGEQVYINGHPIKEPYAYYDPRILHARQLAGEPPAHFGPVKVPPGHLFMMGDNRFNSSDSRYWGFVDAKTVMGRGWVIYFSHNPNDGWFEGYRLGRIAKVIN